MIYIESLARVKSLSRSGYLARYLHLADSIYGLWPQQCSKFNLKLGGSLEISLPDIHLESDEGSTSEKIVLALCGSTSFPELVATISDYEFVHKLNEFGFRRLLIQKGTSEIKNSIVELLDCMDFEVEFFNMLPLAELRRLISKAGLIITHGGVASILEAIRNSSRDCEIAVVPNPNVVGNHQWELVEQFQDLVHCVPFEKPLHFLDNLYSISPEKGNQNSNRKTRSVRFNTSNEFKNETSTFLQQDFSVIPKFAGSLISNQLSIVVPCISGDIPIMHILLESLSVYLEPDLVHAIFIIVPDRQIDDFTVAVKTVVPAARLLDKIKVLPESNFLPPNIDQFTLSQCYRNYKSGWFKQQIIKLASAFHVKTEFYLVLDADCILIKPISKLSDLIVVSDSDGSCRSVLQVEEGFPHPNWTAGSAKLLGLSSYEVSNAMSHFGIGVTPQIFSVDLVHSLCMHLEAAHPAGGSWSQILSRNRVQFTFSPRNGQRKHLIWTEFQLYYLYAKHSRLLDKFHVCRENVLADYRVCAWETGHIKDWCATGDGFFTIFQSNLGLGPEIPRAFLQHLINSLKISENHVIVRTRKIYVLSSELEFRPIIGGINTFLRILLTEIIDNGSTLFDRFEFVFCGLKCKETETESNEFAIPVPKLHFKYFETPLSSLARTLKEYFEDSHSYQSLFRDLQYFGRAALNWIKDDSKPGDILITTIPYECCLSALESLVHEHKVQLVHTVHSLVALKLLNCTRLISYERMSLKEILGHFVLVRLLCIDEKKLLSLANSNFLSKIALPELVRKSLQIEFFLMENSKAIFVPSAGLCYQLSELYPGPGNYKARYVPWGFPDKTVIGEEPVVSTSNSDRPQKSLKGQIHCLVMSKIAPQKGIDILLDTFKCIETLDPLISRRLVLHICGDSSYLYDAHYKAKIESKVKVLKNVNVIFHGWVSGQDKLAQFSAAHFFLSTSLTEPFGFSIVEAMVFGIPIIAFAAEGPRDLVQRDFGYLVKVSADLGSMCQELAIAMIHLCYGDDEKYERMCRNAIEAAAKWKSDKLINNIHSLC